MFRKEAENKLQLDSPPNHSIHSIIVRYQLCAKDTEVKAERRGEE